MSTGPKLTHVNRKYIEQVGNKGKCKIKECYFYENNGLFQLKNGQRLVLMSDLHSLADHIVDDLIRKKKIDKNTIVISTGDMSGNNKIGGDGDPYSTYCKIAKHAASFYFVNGNHDFANPGFMDLINTDGTTCAVGLSTKVQSTSIGTITGVDGIMVSDDQIDNSLHRYSSHTYQTGIQTAYSLKPDILLTHQPILNINPELGIKYYICGHYHIDPHIQIFADYSIINLDNKILIFE